jgi:imidazolonepropionase-like amidohydrolase
MIDSTLDWLDEHLIAVADDDRVTVLRNARLLDGKGGDRARTRITIRGERIADIADDLVPEPPDPAARVIDCHGRTVVPGLMDAHVHFLGNTAHDAINGHLRPADNERLLRATAEYAQTLRWGVTTVRHLGHGPAELAYALRAARAEGLVVGPRVLTSGWALSQTRGHGDVPELPFDWVDQHRPRSAFCDGPDECRRLVRLNLGEGADVIKVYGMDNRSGQPDFARDELAAVVDEANLHGVPVACHAKSVESVRRAVEAGIHTIEHGPAVVDRSLIELMAERGVFLVPTLAFLDDIVRGGGPGVSEATRTERARELAGRMAVVCAAAEAGVRIATGSDTGVRENFGRLSVRELALLAEAGLEPQTVLAASTSVAAEALRIDGDVGSVEIGKLADLVVVDGDPLTNFGIFEQPERIVWIVQSSEPLSC